MDNKAILIRADAGTRIGTGHIMRCLALAQAWRRSGGEATFVMATESPVLERRLRDSGMDIRHINVALGSQEDVQQTLSLAKKIGVYWLVVDGYHFDATYQQAIKGAGYRLLFIDDYGHADHYYADIVLNQNISADDSLYTNREPYTRLLLGTKYILLREEFLAWKDWQREVPEVARKILVTLGGGDPDNVTLKVINAINKLEMEGLEIKVVIGPANPHIASLKEVIDLSPFTFHLLSSIKNMPELMAWADMAVSAGGSTCWELAFIGVPAIIVVLAENQRRIAEELDQAGAAVNTGFYDAVEPAKIAEALKRLLFKGDKRAAMSNRARKLVDGKGKERIVEILSSTVILLRKARDTDSEMVWEWANDSVAREVSFHCDPIPRESHEGWFLSKLKDPDCVFFVAENQLGKPVGQIRFDIEGDEAAVSVSVGPQFRGYGLGSDLIRKACELIIGESKIKTIHALIKEKNTASIRAFEKAGFAIADNIIHKGFKTIIMLYGNQADK